MATQETSPLRMVVFAGPNGSGKSTLTKEFERHGEIPGIYINADDIARDELGHISNELQRNLEAAKMAEQRRQAALESGQSFAFETVMSTPGKLAILQEAKSRWFQTELAFVATANAAHNINRIKNRVALGGHNVDPMKVQERYDRVMRLLPSAVEIADKAIVFDNSLPKDPLLCVAIKIENTLTLLNADKAPEWVRERLVEPLQARSVSRANMVDACQQRAGRLPCVLQNASIVHGSTYQGVIVAVDDYHVAQRTDANTYIIHDCALCPDMDFQKGQFATIPYTYEKGGKHKAVSAVVEPTSLSASMLDKRDFINLETAGPLRQIALQLVPHFKPGMMSTMASVNILKAKAPYLYEAALEGATSQQMEQTPNVETPQPAVAELDIKSTADKQADETPNHSDNTSSPSI